MTEREETLKKRRNKRLEEKEQEREIIKVGKPPRERRPKRRGRNTGRRETIKRMYDE